MSRHQETNPHFGPPPSEDQPLRSPRRGGAAARLPQHRDQRSRPAGPLVRGPRPQDQQNQPLGSAVPQPLRPEQPLETGPVQPQPEDHHNWPLRRQPHPQDQQSLQPESGYQRSTSRFPLPWRLGSSRHSSPRITEQQRQDDPSQPLTSPKPQPKKKPKSQEPKRKDKRKPLGPWAMLPEHHDQDYQPSSPRVPRRKEGGLGPWAMLPGHHDQQSPPQHPQEPQLKEGLPEQKDPLSQPHTPMARHPPQHGYPSLQGHHLPQQGHPPSHQGLPQPHHGHPPSHQGHPQPNDGHSSSHQGHQPHQGRRPAQGHEATPPGRHSRRQGLLKPSPRRTKFITWFLAGFCAIFWILIILGGLIVLIVYLVFRPHSPQFDVAGVTLNAAYLDMGILLNADVTVLANFSNPNRKVKVDFSYAVLDLYYGSTLIASQFVQPFSAARKEYRLQDIHLVTSQVRLPQGEIDRIKREASANAIMFKIKGVFHARSNLGSLLRYSYRLYGTCTVMVNSPPTGVIRAKRCKTKR